MIADNRVRNTKSSISHRTHPDVVIVGHPAIVESKKIDQVNKLIILSLAAKPHCRRLCQTPLFGVLLVLTPHLSPLPSGRGEAELCALSEMANHRSFNLKRAADGEFETPHA